MELKKIFFLLLCCSCITYAQLSPQFPQELDALIKANFAQVKGKSKGYDKTLKGEVFSTDYKITDFKIKAVEVSFTENFILAEYTQKGDDALMDDLFNKTMTLPYNRYDSKNNPLLLSDADKEKGVIRKIEIRKRFGSNSGTANLLAEITLDNVGKIVIRFTTKY
ncbi:MAG: hypothetical protein RLZZ500_1186 [Bacteroidota bacterium]|jgi:hypothetical protein